MTAKKCPLDGENIDYKNVELLKKYITKFGKIVPRYYSGICLKNQKKLANEIKKARIMALLPFVKGYDPTVVPKEVVKKVYSAKTTDEVQDIDAEVKVAA